MSSLQEIFPVNLCFICPKGSLGWVAKGTQKNPQSLENSNDRHDSRPCFLSWQTASLLSSPHPFPIIHHFYFPSIFWIHPLLDVLAAPSIYASTMQCFRIRGGTAPSGAFGDWEGVLFVPVHEEAHCWHTPGGGWDQGVLTPHPVPTTLQN